jgi:hypothetical protein
LATGTFDRALRSFSEIITTFDRRYIDRCECAYDDHWIHRFALFYGGNYKDYSAFVNFMKRLQLSLKATIYSLQSLRVNNLVFRENNFRFLVCIAEY